VPDTATRQVTPDQDAIISEIDIAAPPDRVFRALIDPRQVLQWWGQEGVYRCTEFASDVRPGGQWRSAGVGPDGGRFEASGEYIEVDPPRLLIELPLSHSGLSAHPELAQSYRGWPRMLEWLKAFLERGETVEMRAPFSKAGD
jgi:uncharacterized protein YndB with AHSA1/START domain